MLEIVRWRCAVLARFSSSVLRVSSSAWSWRTLGTPLGTLYRGREGMWAWLLHRITGVAIFFFLLVHILDTALVRLAPEAYNQVIGMYHTPIMAIGEAGIVAAVTLHALNGIRIILMDAFPWGARYQRRMFYGVLALFVLVMAVFLPIHFAHAFARVYDHDWHANSSAPLIETRALFTYLAMVLAPIPSLTKRNPSDGSYRHSAARTLRVAAGEEDRRISKTQQVLNPNSRNYLNNVLRRGTFSRNFRETAGWLFMRGSGILLLVLVAGHLITNLMMGDGVRQINFAFVAGKWASPFWQTWSLLLLLLALIHGANGVRTLIDDYATAAPARLVLKSLLYLATAVMALLGLLVIFTLDPCPPGAAPHLVPNFCHVGG